MENFVLYEELGRGDHSIIYKGRRKGTITFVAIHCIDKCKRPEVTNTVRMTHDILHQNVVKFYEWYETSNHLWLVVELCTGGSLETLIVQDKHLPESTVRSFGIDLVTGLHYIHSLGILFCDLCPSKVLLDTPGTLKYSDFGLSKVEGENLKELFNKFADAGEMWNTETSVEEGRALKTSGSITYMAPEVIQCGDYTILSDLWSLGCVLYELFTGHPPFLAESESQLQDKIMHKEFATPKVKGSRFSGKPSPDYISLLEGLLHKDPLKRMGWPGLVNHAFWNGELSYLAKDFIMSQELRGSVSTTVTSSIFEHGGSSALGRIKGIEMKKSMDRPMTAAVDTVDGTRPSTAVGDYLRPKTAPGNDGGESIFTLSARPHTAVAPEDAVHSPYKQGTAPLTTREAITSGLSETDEQKNEILELMFHSSDFVATPIVDNPKIQKPASTKYDLKTLPVPPYSVEKVKGLAERDFSKHMKAIMECLMVAEKGPTSQKRVQLLQYLANITTEKSVATALLKANSISVLVKMLKETVHYDVRTKISRVIALIARNTSYLDENINISESMGILTELIRENAKNGKMKQALLPAIGEILYLVAKEEEVRGLGIENWLIPSMTFTVVGRCCKEGEDAIVNHMAAKIIENVTSVKGSHAQKFVTNEMGHSLWYLYKHSTVDSLRITALSALSNLTWHSPSVFQSVLDTVGLSPVIQAMSIGIARIQKSIITMFGSLISSGSNISRLLQDKDLLQKIMRLLESPSTVIRAKAFLVLHELFKTNNEMLLTSCNSRLVMYIERDSRRQTPRDGRSDNQEGWDYLSKCLDKIICYITDTAPAIKSEIIMALSSASGRKHPSNVQIKQLKSSLPLMSIFLHLVTSQVFRVRIVNEEFIKDMGNLLGHIKKIESGDTNIEPATGANGVSEFINNVISVLEAICQHPGLLVEHHVCVMDAILPVLADLVSTQNSDTRALSLRLFSEIAAVYLGQESITSENKVNVKHLHNIITDCLLPQFEQLLFEPDPLPSHGLKLLLAVLEQNAGFVKKFQEMGMVQVVFQVLLDHQGHAVSSVMQYIVGIINCLVGLKETNMKDLYDQGLIDCFTTLFCEVTVVCFEGEDNRNESKTAVSLLQTLLETLQNMFKYLSDVVRKALQSKRTGEKGNRDAEDAENMLLINKSLTDLTGLLTQLLCHEDTDIQDSALKSLSLLVQLFGGEFKEAMSPEYMEYYSRCLKNANAKKQKVILRIIKRLITSDKHHVDSMKQYGEQLADTIKSLVHTASSHADMGISSVAADILKSTGHLS